jgi:hypothetical protein
MCFCLSSVAGGLLSTAPLLPIPPSLTPPLHFTAAFVLTPSPPPVAGKYSEAFVNEFKIFYAELRDFFNAATLTTLLDEVRSSFNGDASELQFFDRFSMLKRELDGKDQVGGVWVWVGWGGRVQGCARGSTAGWAMLCHARYNCKLWSWCGAAVLSL